LFEKVISCSSVIFSLKRHRGKRIHGRVPVVVWVLFFVLQLALVPVTIDASSQILGKFFKEAALPFAFLDFSMKVFQTLLPDFIGFALGLLLRPFPFAVREPARWLFVVPAAAYPVFAVASFFTSFHELLVFLFGIRGNNYEGSGVLALLFPAVGICLYSLGVRASDRYTDPLANVFTDEDLDPDDGQAEARVRRVPDPDSTDPDSGPHAETH
jgi:hypothetical protein